VTKRHRRPPATQGPPPGPAPSVSLLGGWATTAARVALGLVLAWFGYHELVAPALWTGYVPVLSPTSTLAVLAVLAHGFVLLLLAAALVTGVAHRAAAACAAVLLAEIVVALAVTGGLSDIVLRDLGVLGLSLALLGDEPQRLVLTR
jgi:predicted acyltransferase